MTMTVAGHYKIPYEEAEVLKTTPEKEDEIFPVVKATIEKMATITEKFLNGYQVPAVYVVGGSASFREFTNVFEKKLKLPVYRPVIGFDKQEIVERSWEIGTYDTSVLPYEDCCTIFVAKHPVTKPNLNIIKNDEKHLDDCIEEMLKTAIDTVERIEIK